MWGVFSEVLVGGGGGGGDKKGGIQCFVVVQWAGQLFLNELQKYPFHSYLGSCIEYNFSYSCYVIIDYHVIHIFYIFLLLLSSIAFSGFHPIFTIYSMQKCEHNAKGKRFSVWSKESFLILSYFLKLGIWLWTEYIC